MSAPRFTVTARKVPLFENLILGRWIVSCLASHTDEVVTAHYSETRAGGYELSCTCCKAGCAHRTEVAALLEPRAA